MKKILVNIFLSYLRFFAKVRLGRVNPLIIGVGGSSGKTSTALLSAQILKEKYVVLESKGKNSQTGIPLSILGLSTGRYTFLDWLKIALLAPFRSIFNKNRFNVFVIEMGIDSPFPPNNMSYLLKVVRPNIAILTDVSLEHSHYFDPLVKEDEDSKRKEEILSLTAKEETLLIKSVAKRGTAIVNMDNQYIKDSLNTLSSNVVTVSAKDKNATFYIKEIESSLKSFSINFDYKGREHRIFIAHPLPSHFGYTILLSLGAAITAGMGLEEATNSLKKNFKLPPGRFSMFKGIKDSVIIDSSYNSSLVPAREVLENVSQIAKGRRRVAILGDMRELGSLTKNTHEELAKVIVNNLDFAFLIGPQMVKYVSPILKDKGFKYVAFDTYEKAKYRISDYIESKDIIVVKGSQNTLFLERVVENLLKDPKDAEYLCRRGQYWDEQRNK